LQKALALDPWIVLARTNLSRHHALAGEWDQVDTLLDDPVGIPASVMFPAKVRFLVWRRDARGAAELLAKLDPAHWAYRTMKTFAQIAMGVELPDDDLFPDPPNIGYRLRGIFAQFRAEGAAAMGRTSVALHHIEQADGFRLFDIGWLDRCPLLEAIRA